jgi:hypothetical protein
MGPFDENRIAPKRIASNDLYSDPAIHDSGGLWTSVFETNAKSNQVARAKTKGQLIRT